MPDPVLQASGLTKSFGAVAASRNVSIDLLPGEIHALIGPNGAGKSTLVKQLTGEIRPDSGRVILEGRDVTALTVARRAALGIGRSFQVSSIINGMTLTENLLVALEARAGRIFNLIAPATGRSAPMAEVARLLVQAGLDGKGNMRASQLSHGERRRLELAMVLALEPKVFLLDEPMAGLGAEGGMEFRTLLGELRSKAPILLIEHDMDAVFALADRISVLVYGEIIATGTVDEVRSNTAVQQAYLGEDHPAGSLAHG